MHQERIFGIGLSKTGTTSLTRALQILGYRTNHFPYSALRFNAGRLNLDIGRISKWDAVTDSPVALFFRRLEEHFTTGRFILTTRDVDAWLNSCEYNHVWPGDYVRNKGIRKFPHIRKILCLHRNAYGSENFDRNAFRKAYEAHIASVREHFRQKGRELLELDICSGDGWEPLCDYLGKPVPDVPFPFENVGKFKQLKRNSRRFLWRSLELLPTSSLNETHIKQIIASSAYID